MNRRCEPQGAPRPFDESAIADPAIHELSTRLARACRYVVQSCLREEEWGLCDAEFYRQIRSGLEAFEAERKGGMKA